MTDEARTDRNRQRLKELHPVVRSRLARVIALLERDGFRPRIQDAWRSPADQLKAYNSGNSQLRYGFHNVTAPDGSPESLAADVLDDDRPLEPSRAYVFMLAKYARANGLDTGIEWGLPAPIRRALSYALANEDHWDGKLGWDSLHVQWDGITVQQAKAGIRPVTDERNV